MPLPCNYTAPTDPLPRKTLITGTAHCHGSRRWPFLLAMRGLPITVSWWSDDVTVRCGWLHLQMLSDMSRAKARARDSSVMAFQRICDTAWWVNGAAS